MAQDVVNKADDVRRMADDANKLHAEYARIRELEAALKRIVLKDGRESITVTKICDIARTALAGRPLSDASKPCI